jgi:hypothetical protein
MKILIKFFSLKKFFPFLIIQTIILIVLINLSLINYVLRMNSLTENYVIFNQNEWIFNFNVTQYSSIISSDRENNLIVESLIFYDHLEDWNYRKKYTKCYLSLNENLIELDSFELMNIPLMSIKFFSKAFCRIKCKLNKGNLTNNQIKSVKVAIVDSKYFGYYNDQFNKSKKLLTFQQPLYFNQSIPKKKTVANCVHMVTKLDTNNRLKKITDWIDMMNSIGYSKIKLYLHNISKSTKDVLIEKQKTFENGFLDLISYSTSFDELCKYSISKLNETPDSKLYQFLYSNCKSSFEKHFRMSDLMIYNSHERMTSNECLQSFRYEYEFITNYDFDEIIFPRLYNTDIFNYARLDNLNENKLINSGELKKYQIYDYAKKLQNKYGSQVAFFHHDHVLFLCNFDNFINQVYNFTFNRNISNQEIIYANYGRLVKFSIKDELHLNQLKKIIKVVNYLNKTFFKSKYHSKWNNLYASKMNMRGISLNFLIKSPYFIKLILHTLKFRWKINICN